MSDPFENCCVVVVAAAAAAAAAAAVGEWKDNENVSETI